MLRKGQCFPKEFSVTDTKSTVNVSLTIIVTTRMVVFSTVLALSRGVCGDCESHKTGLSGNILIPLLGLHFPTLRNQIERISI